MNKSCIYFFKEFSLGESLCDSRAERPTGLESVVPEEMEGVEGRTHAHTIHIGRLINKFSILLSLFYNYIEIKSKIINFSTFLVFLLICHWLRLFVSGERHAGESYLLFYSKVQNTNLINN